MDPKKFIQLDYVYAVVGATTNKEKYGYKVLMDLHAGGYTVVGVNPKYHEIDGVIVYPTFEDIPGKVDVAVFVVPPEVGLHLLPQVEEKGITKIWFQPGARNAELVKATKEAGLTMNDEEACIMVQRRGVSEQP